MSEVEHEEEADTGVTYEPPSSEFYPNKSTNPVPQPEPSQPFIVQTEQVVQPVPQEAPPETIENEQEYGTNVTYEPTPAGPTREEVLGRPDVIVDTSLPPSPIERSSNVSPEQVEPQQVTPSALPRAWGEPSPGYAKIPEPEGMELVGVKEQLSSNPMANWGVTPKKETVAYYVPKGTFDKTLYSLPVIGNLPFSRESTPEEKELFKQQTLEHGYVHTESERSVWGDLTLKAMVVVPAITSPALAVGAIGGVGVGTGVKYGLTGHALTDQEIFIAAGIGELAVGVGKPIAERAINRYVAPRVQTKVDASYRQSAENLETWQPSLSEKVGMKLTGVSPREPAPGTQSLPNIQSGEFTEQKISQLETGKLTGKQYLETRTRLVETQTPESIRSIPKMQSGLEYDEWLSPNTTLYGRTMEPTIPSSTVPTGKPVLPVYVFLPGKGLVPETKSLYFDKGLESPGATTKPFENPSGPEGFNKTPSRMGYDGRLAFEKPSMTYDALSRQQVVTSTRPITQAPTIPRTQPIGLTAPKIVTSISPAFLAMPTGILGSTQQRPVTTTTIPRTITKPVTNPFTQTYNYPGTTRQPQYSDDELYAVTPPTSPLRSPELAPVITKEKPFPIIQMPQTQRPTEPQVTVPFSFPIQTPKPTPSQMPKSIPILDLAEEPAQGQPWPEPQQPQIPVPTQVYEIPTGPKLPTSNAFKGFDLPGQLGPTEGRGKPRRGKRSGYGKFMWEFPVVEPSRIFKKDYMRKKR